MANASFLTLTEGPPSSLTAPPAGSGAIFVDTSNHVNTLGPSSQVWIPGLQTSTTAASAAINTSEALISNALAIPVGLLQVGTTIRFTATGSCTATVSNNSTFTLRAGTLGTVSDQAVSATLFGSAAAGTGVRFQIQLTWTVLTTGATGTTAGQFLLVNRGTTGIWSETTLPSITVAGTNLATTTATFLSVSYKTAASTTTTTFDAGTILEVLPL